MHLKAHPQTVRKYLRKYEIKVLRGPKKHSKRSNPASFGEWLRNYTPEQIPGSIKELSQLSGITTHAIRNYLYRLRKKSRAILGVTPWIGSDIVVWVDIQGQHIPDIAFDTVHPYVGQSGIIKFHVRLMSGHVHVFRYTSDQLEELYRPKKEGA